MGIKYQFTKKYKGYKKGDIDTLLDKKEIDFLIETGTIIKTKTQNGANENTFIKENKELKLENEEIKEENKKLKLENDKLQKELDKINKKIEKEGK